MVARWFHEGLNAFNTNLEDGNILAELFGERLLHLSKSLSGKDAEAELEPLIAETSGFHEKLQKILLKDATDCWK